MIVGQYSQSLEVILRLAAVGVHEAAQIVGRLLTGKSNLHISSLHGFKFFWRWWCYRGLQTMLL